METKLAELEREKEREKGERVITVQVPVEVQRFRRLSVEERVEIVRKLYFDEGLTYDQIAKVLRISPRDIAKAVRGEKITETEADKLRAEIRECKQKIKELEERLDRASRFIRATFAHFTVEYSDLFGSEKVKGKLFVFCPYCRKLVHLTYKEVPTPESEKEREKTVKMWVCEKCGRIPF
ncbi:MAG: hypothetical protein OCU22_10115 [Canidatus Methanoxibalbensis ujae]|nr:hypothetical protein [Candidatus Methanoxibalbensis ujae]